MSGDSIEKKLDRAFFVFGRCNPPTIGHKRLIDKLIELAEEARADAYVFVTSTQDKKKNPLSVGEKVDILKDMYHKSGIVRIINTTVCGCKTIPQVINSLNDAGYESLTIVAGGSRVEDFTGKFKGVDVVSGGERDPDSEDLSTAISATNVRRAAMANNWHAFRAGMDTSVSNSKVRKTMNAIRNRQGGGARKTKKRRAGKR